MEPEDGEPNGRGFEPPSCLAIPVHCEGYEQARDQVLGGRMSMREEHFATRGPCDSRIASHWVEGDSQIASHG